MASAVVRLTTKLQDKLAAQDYYEAHQLYRTIYFRLQRDIKFNFLIAPPEDGPATERWAALLENRVAFINQNPSYTFLLEFLSTGASTLLQQKELISGLDLIKLFLAQFNHLLFDGHSKPNTDTPELQAQVGSALSEYYTALHKWFSVLMDVVHLYAETGLEMVQDKSRQVKGFVESDFLSERDLLLESVLQCSKSLRVSPGDSSVEVRIRNAFIRSHGYPEMHLRNGRLLVRFQELSKARHCFLYCQDAFELAKFLHLHHRAQHNTATEYETVLVKAVLRVLNTQLFINARPGTHSRAQHTDTFKRLQGATFSTEDMATLKVRALEYAKQVLHFYLAISKFQMLRQEERTEHTARFFRRQHLVRFLHLYLVLLEELLRQEDTVPAESAFHFHTGLVRQMRRHFRCQGQPCFGSEREAEQFLDFFGVRGRGQDPAEALAERAAEEGKPYLLKLFYELRVHVYQPTIKYHTGLDRELDMNLLDAIFFSYYNAPVPQGLPELRDPRTTGYFEPEESRAQQQPPNLFSMLMGGMAGGSGAGQEGGGMNLMSLLNDFMQ